MELNGLAAERVLAALDLLCTVEERAVGLRAHPLALPIMVAKMKGMEGRGKEYALSALTVVYGGRVVEEQAPLEEVAHAMVLALQGNYKARAG